MMSVNEMRDRIVGLRRVVLPIAGGALAWLFAMGALNIQANEVPQLINLVWGTCYIIGLAIITLECGPFTSKQLFSYFLIVMYTLTEPVVYMFLFLEGLGWLGVVQTLPFQRMALWFGTMSLTSLHGVVVQIAIGFILHRFVPRR